MSTNNHTLNEAAQQEHERMRKEAENAEIARLKAELAEMKRKYMFTYCAYCGYEIAVDSDEDMGEHIQECKKHPMYKLTAELAALRAENERLRTDIVEANVAGVRHKKVAEALAHELAVRERQAEILAEWELKHRGWKASKGWNIERAIKWETDTALSQARAELDCKARITSLLSGRQQSEPSPDADLMAANDIPPDPVAIVDEIEEAYHSADDSTLVFKEAKP